MGPTGATGATGPAIALAYGSYTNDGTTEVVAHLAAVSFPTTFTQNGVIKSGPNTTFTVPSTGDYFVSAGVAGYWNAGAPGTGAFSVFLNGVAQTNLTFEVPQAPSIIGPFQLHTIDSIIHLNAGDQLQLVNFTDTLTGSTPFTLVESIGLSTTAFIVIERIGP